MDYDIAIKLLTYDAMSGVLYWRERPRTMFNSDKAHRSWNRRFANKPSGGISEVANGRKYWRLRYAGKKYWQHRLIWLIAHGEAPLVIDHINRDTLDNRLVNLRSVTHQENLKNRGMQANNTSGHTGVHRLKSNGKWLVNTRWEGKTRHLGIFEDFNEACALSDLVRSEAGYLNKLIESASKGATK